ncbi:MAG: hypothetical protein HPY78_09405 [Brevinematales bacterium]|nr:hypothetical protein [Brevinematales bacterium]
MTEQKKKYYLSPIIFGLLLPLSLWAGPLFHRSTEVQEVSTKHFRILYASSQTNTVARLVSMADTIYEEWINRLGLSKTYRFLVIITPDIEIMNGMFTSLPRNTIILYEYLSDPMLVPSDDALKALFTHELLHAISLSVRTAEWDFLSFLMGDFLSPQYVQLPWWMIEGVTVSGESASGHGRVNSPSHRAILIQHLLENRFEAYSDVAQIRYGKGGYHYIYGGFFSDYLQKKYGWEKYGELFKVSATRFWPYSFQSSFQRVYGTSIDKEWASFRSNFLLEVVPLPIEEKLLKEGKSLSLRSTKNGLYIIDREKDKVYQWKNQKLVYLGDGEDVASDGVAIAFRRIRFKEGKPQDGFVLYQNRKKTFLPHVRDMDIQGNRLLMVKVDGFESRLVFEDNGLSKTLLEAHPYRQYLFPRFVDDQRFVCVILITNRPYLGVGNVESGEMTFYDLSAYEITSLAVEKNKVWLTLFPREGNSLGRIGLFSLEEERLDVFGVETSGGFYQIGVFDTHLYVIKRYAEKSQCVSIKKDEVISKLPRKEEKKESLALDFTPYQQENLVLHPSSARKFSDQLPAVRIPLFYPDPIALLYGYIFWDSSLFLYNEDPLQENSTYIELHYLSPWQTMTWYGEWQNRYFYPFSTFVGYGGYLTPLGPEPGNLVTGFSYQWDVSFRERVAWRNAFQFTQGFSFGYTTSLVWAISQAYLSTPYDIFQGPLFLQAYVDNSKNYYTYGNLVYSTKGLSLGILGGWGNVSFFSPLDTLRNYTVLTETLPENSPTYWGRSLYNGVVGTHGFWILPLSVEAGYKHFPVYFESVGAVVGSYALLLSRPNTLREFYGAYVQIYAKWLLGYVLPLTTLWEYQYTTDGWYTSLGIASSF